jgi:CheY-like chemotaxis protein
MDGREVLRRIKAEPRWRATPVIMISGEQDMEGIVDCIEAGADDYLFKPFNPGASAGADQGRHRAQALARPRAAVPTPARAQ